MTYDELESDRRKFAAIMTHEMVNDPEWADIIDDWHVEITAIIREQWLARVRESNDQEDW